jgi:hypothetical protein
LMLREVVAGIGGGVRRQRLSRHPHGHPGQRRRRSRHAASSRHALYYDQPYPNPLTVFNRATFRLFDFSTFPPTAPTHARHKCWHIPRKACVTLCHLRFCRTYAHVAAPDPSRARQQAVPEMFDPRRILAKKVRSQSASRLRIPPGPSSPTAYSPQPVSHSGHLALAPSRHSKRADGTIPNQSWVVNDRGQDRKKEKT